MPNPMHFDTPSANVSFCSERSDDARSLDCCHCHEDYEILYVLRGEGCYVVEGDEYTMSEGTLMLIRPLKYHFVRIDSGVIYERYVVHFSPSALIPEAAALLEQMEEHAETGNGHFYPSHALPPSVMEAFARLSGIARMPHAMQSAYFKTLLSEIVLLLSTASAERLPNDNDDLSVRVLRYLNDHLEETIPLDSLARQFFVSKYYLCRAFKKHNGISIHMYVTQKRVMQAKRLIEAGESASSAAYRVGFGDYSAFYRAFVKVTGHSPVSKTKPNEKEV